MFISQAKNDQSRNGTSSTPGNGRIDDNLRKVYDNLVNDDVPDRFEELLRKLREQEGKK